MKKIIGKSFTKVALEWDFIKFRKSLFIATSIFTLAGNIYGYKSSYENKKIVTALENIKPFCKNVLGINDGDWNQQNIRKEIYEVLSKNKSQYDDLYTAVINNVLPNSSKTLTNRTEFNKKQQARMALVYAYSNDDENNFSSCKKINDILNKKDNEKCSFIDRNSRNFNQVFVYMKNKYKKNTDVCNIDVNAKDGSFIDDLIKRMKGYNDENLDINICKFLVIEIFDGHSEDYLPTQDSIKKFIAQKEHQFGRGLSTAKGIVTDTAKLAGGTVVAGVAATGSAITGAVAGAVAGAGGAVVAPAAGLGYLVHRKTKDSHNNLGFEKTANFVEDKRVRIGRALTALTTPAKNNIEQNNGSVIQSEIANKNGKRIYHWGTTGISGAVGLAGGIIAAPVTMPLGFLLGGVTGAATGLIGGVGATNKVLHIHNRSKDSSIMKDVGSAGFGGSIWSLKKLKGF